LDHLKRFPHGVSVFPMNLELEVWRPSVFLNEVDDPLLFQVIAELIMFAGFVSGED